MNLNLKTRAGQQTTAKENPLATLSLQELMKKLETSQAGLRKQQVINRLTQYGYNELSEESVNPLLKFLSYFWGPIPWMIEIAALLSIFVKHWADFGIITALLVVNAIVGFWEEYQAGNAIAALKSQLALQAKVKRDGDWVIIPARELVPGDVIRLRLGDIIPADIQLFDCDPVEVDQSALTGESLPVTREVGDTLYSGSVLKQGEADGVVYATGQHTYFGKTAQLVESAHTTSHFQRAVLKIGDYLIVLALVLVVLILGVALFRGDQMITTLQFALVLTVAAIPVAMPTVLSVTMAVGARLLSTKQAIVSRLAAIEELAGINVLCSDKTGTLTQNKLTLGDPWSMKGLDSKQVVLYGALASRREDHDPIETAIFASVPADTDLSAYQIEHFQPFDPVHKRSESQVLFPDKSKLRVTKGAAQVILEMCHMTDQARQDVDRVVDDFAHRGYRALGVAYSEDKKDAPWHLAGILPLYDPPRVDSRETIENARKMGVDVKMVTGDQLAIAREIAGQLDIGNRILDASVLEQTHQHQMGQVNDEIEKANGFAQVFPEHKYHIVQTLQERGHIVGMTGDGVNDAPALKKADAGIAVSGATDAARAAADIVLMTPGLSVIIDAIKESRKIFQRMNSYSIYRIAETIRVLLFMTFSILVFNFYPVTAIMIVLLALLNDGAILSIAYDRVQYSEKPEVWDMPLVLGISTVLGIMGVIASFGMFYLAERVFNLDQSVVQSIMYLKLSVAGHLTIFLTRTRKAFWSSRPAPILLGAVFGTQFVATLIAVYGLFMTPIGWGWALFIWGYALAWFFINDLVKQAAYRVFSRRGQGLLVAHH
jgi:H+-transporting ATPase